MGAPLAVEAEGQLSGFVRRVGPGTAPEKAEGLVVVGAEGAPEKWKVPPPTPNPVTSKALRINHSRETAFILTQDPLTVRKSICFRVPVLLWPSRL